VGQVGQIPRLDMWLMKNPVRLWLGRLGVVRSVSPVAAFAKTKMLDRAKNEKQEEAISLDTKGGVQRRDFLSRFLEANQKDPEFINNDRVHALTLTNVFAGSDTTGITLRAIFYYLMRNPGDMKKLNDELAEQEKLGNFSAENGLVGWNEVRELPFLNAVVKEALRCHPAAGLPLERIVPPRGLELHGHHIPGGTIVGLSAWVVHRDKTIFGEDAAQWRPDRWIEASSDQKRLMENSIFAFGAGSRTCIGKNISLLEMYKLVPAILRRFEVRANTKAMINIRLANLQSQINFADPNKEWKLHNGKCLPIIFLITKVKTDSFEISAWFVKQSEFYVRLRMKTKG
jgi:cytochrome P450